MAAESNLERKITAHAKSLGMMVFKFTSPGNRGVPDRVFLFQGRCLFLEVKAPGERPTVIQEHMIQRLRDKGIPAGWTDNFTEAISMLADFYHTPGNFNRIYK